jgi:DNA invertase Pin-like site-specific DNA recombinase
MSTEHQRYSPKNQLDIIRQYAADHNMEIVQVYSDHGRNGLNIAGREGLNQLMSDVENKRVNFTSLLVYDARRWGRFQDVDESAYYEYVLMDQIDRPSSAHQSQMHRREHLQPALIQA